MKRSSTIFFSILLLCAGAPRAGESADAIVKASGARPGLCIVIGARDGKLCADLAGAGYTVHGLALTEAAAAKVRGYLHSKKLYGKVTASRGSAGRLPYGDSLANLLVADGVKGLSAKEVARVICPYGVAVVKGASAAKVKAALAGMKTVTVSESGGWVRITKRPPPGVDEWRQWRHNATLDLTSKDMVVQPPAHLKWIYGPNRGRNHKGHPRALRSAQGRNFIIYDKSPPLYEVPSTMVLVCRDAYNGLILWERPIPKPSTRTLLAVGERVYVTFERSGPLCELDAATGKTLREFKQRPTGVSLVGEDLLLAGGGPIRMMNRKTGELKWQSKLSQLVKSKVVAVSDGKIYAQKGQRADGWECAAIVCLSLADGKELWSRSHKDLVRSSLISARDGVVVFASYKGPALQVMDAKNGDILWTHKYPHPGHGGSYSNVFVLGGMVWFHDNGSRKAKPPRPMAWVGFDARTGKHKKSIPGRLMQKCFRDGATEKYILSGTMNFVDWKEGKTLRNRAVRAVCRVGYFVANGMNYTFPTDCKCFPWLRGTIGLAPSTLETPIKPGESPRLVSGPAAGKATGPEAGKGDWPIYRAASSRHGVGGEEVPSGAKELFAADLGGRLSAPTVAAGKVFVSSVNRHQVHALDAKSGEKLWSFATGADVDGPPTYFRGRAIFGCNDGWVYSLRASDGKLAWKFRAAPTERMIMAYGQPESTWPVKASVLVEGGKVLFAAGRHSELDGGMKIVCLEAESGKLVWEKKPALSTYPDILVRGGKYVYMSQLRVAIADGGTAAARYGEFRHIGKKVDFKKLPDQQQPLFSAGSSSSFGDSTYAFRSRWVYSPIIAAQMMVFDKQRFVCVRVLPKIKGLQKYSRTRPGKGDHKIWSHPRENGSVQPRKNKTWLKSFSEPKGWSTVVTIRPRALVMAGGNVFAAGPEDAYPAKKSAMICLSAADGKELSRIELSDRPVFDGLVAAGGRLYLATQDGKLRCFGKK